MTDPARAFPADPADARARFTAAATAAGWALEAHRVPSAGPGGEALFIDAAVWLGSDPTRPTVIVTGGVHGVEAPLGVAVALAMLERLPEPAGRVVIVPVVSPWGFAHSRRMSENNVDLNRNFLLPGDTYKGGPALYAAVDGTLNPPTPPPRLDWFLPVAALAIWRHGRKALKDAVAGGQHDYPRGLFYGGPGPAESHAELAKHWRRWAGPAALPGGRAVHLDFHTGLGKWAAHALLLDTPAAPKHVAAAMKLGPVEVADADGVAYDARGGFGPWSRAITAPGDVLYVCAEFGTRPDVTMLAGLRRENRSHHYAAGTPTDRRAKAAARELFCPASPDWRRRVLADAVGIAGRALAGS